MLIRNPFRFFVLLLALIVGQEVRCQTTNSLAPQPRQPTFGIEGGYGYRTDKLSGVIGRVFYAAPFGKFDLEGGGYLTAIDDGFGFDVRTRIPFASSAFHFLGGFGVAVHPFYVSMLIPIGLTYSLIEMVEVSAIATPNFPLTKLDKNSVIYDARIGLRF